MTQTKEPRYIARFVPQAWINDYATEIDHSGPDEWDATEFVKIVDSTYVSGMLEEIESYPDEEALDYFDILVEDPNAPEWVRDHRGPFDTYLRLADPAA